MTTSTRELATYIGKDGHLNLDGLTIQVKVTDARPRYGRIDLEITPVNGTGSRWVESSRVRLDDVVVAGQTAQ